MICMFIQVSEAADDIDKATSRVQKIATELVETEKKYVQKLHLVDQVSFLLACYLILIAWLCFNLIFIFCLLSVLVFLVAVPEEMPTPIEGIDCDQKS